MPKGFGGASPSVSTMSLWEHQQEIEKIRFEKKKKSGLRKCPGHWINKGAKMRNNDCYDEDGKCLRCGGYKRKITA